MSISGFARIFGSRRDEFSPSMSSVFSLMQSRSDCSCYDGLSWTVSLVPSASVFAVFDLLFFWSPLSGDLTDDLIFLTFFVVVAGGAGGLLTPIFSPFFNL